MIAMGTNTDPYQPLERDLRITRSILQVLADFKHPVGIVTKSAHGHARYRHPGADGGRRARRGSRCRSRRSTGNSRAAWSRARRRRARRLETIRALVDAGIPVDGDVGADHPGAQRRRDGIHPRRGGRSRRDDRPATRCCGCRSRSRTCSASGWKPTSPAAESM